MNKSKSEQLRNEGNRHFKDGDYVNAEKLYGLAIQHDNSNPLVWTNRAFARIKLEKWDAAEMDCLRAIDVDPERMKPYYYLAQARLELKRPDEAFAAATRAYAICIILGDASARHISSLLLRIKKEIWEAKEEQRKRDRGLLVVELQDLLEKAAELKIGETESMEEDKDETKQEVSSAQSGVLRDELKKKVEELKSVFSIADIDRSGERVVPDYLIDGISLEIMQDPWITPSGHSYERSTILEHLKLSDVDPITRETLTIADLRPNLALKRACTEFLEQNGWAADY